MKNFLLASIVIFSFFTMRAQSTITNGSMETWTNVGAATEEPQQWNSNKTGGGNAATPGQTCFRETTNPHSGTYCAKVKTTSYIGTVVNGALTTGKVEAPTFTKADGYIRNIAGDPNYAMTFTARPDSFVFWYRYTKAGSDYPKVEARLNVGYAYSPETPSNNNHPDSTQNIIARALWQGAAADQATWVRISVPFTYVAGAAGQRTPQYVFITSTSTGDQAGGTSGSTLWLDDFEAIYNPKIATNSITPSTYYVSSSTGSSISVPFTYNGTFQAGNVFTAQLSDASGSFATPVAIGTISLSASNVWQQTATISGTIPAGTATGTGYRVRVVSNNPAVTGTDNGSNITINLVSNSIAPSTTQTIITNANGTVLNVTETTGSNSREWKYTTTSGSGYGSFGSAQTALSYTPNFSSSGTYYVVCETTYPGGILVRSNEVQINVIGNSIAPPAPQSISQGSNGTILTVTESQTATSRVWKYSTTQGGPYNVFSPTETGTTYTPNFANSGIYYVICESTMGGFPVKSNEVVITVNAVNLSTGAITGSPFEFSPSAPNANNVTVPYTTTGSVFINGNIFTAQLSDASGSFSSATAIGTVTDTTTGTISAIIPSSTPAGTAYRIRVVSSNIALNGSDNGTNLVVDQFNNSISPSTTQSILFNTNGTVLNVNASQNATHEWKYSTTIGGAYQSFNPVKTGSSYTPNFSAPGTYYVVCVSKNRYNDYVTSNEVQIIVNNGNILTTLAVSGSPYLVSSKANVQVSVTFSSNVYFNPGNSFAVELSDQTGSFASPVLLGTASGTTVAPLTVQIPNNSVYGTQYRIRVASSDPLLYGTDNGTNLSIIPFETSVALPDTQRLYLNVAGTTVTVTESHPSTRKWLYSQFSGFSYNPFNPAATGTSYAPKVNALGTYYMICRSVNAVNDTVDSREIVLIVTRDTTGIDNTTTTIKMYTQSGYLNIIRDEAKDENFDLYNMNGQLVLSSRLIDANIKIDISNLSDGIYLFAIGNSRGKINIFGK